MRTSKKCQRGTLRNQQATMTGARARGQPDQVSLPVARVAVAAVVVIGTRGTAFFGRSDTGRLGRESEHRGVSQSVIDGARALRVVGHVALAWVIRGLCAAMVRVRILGKAAISRFRHAFHACAIPVSFSPSFTAAVPTGVVDAAPCAALLLSHHRLPWWKRFVPGGIHKLECRRDLHGARVSAINGITWKAGIEPEKNNTNKNKIERCSIGDVGIGISRRETLTTNCAMRFYTG